MIAVRRHRAWMPLLGALIVAAGVVALVIESQPDGGAAVPQSQLPVFRMEADHATYPSVGSASAEADLIVRGLVQSHTTDPGVSPGVDGLGDPLPTLPHTNYLVSVLETLKGSLAPGATVTISLSGGTTEEGKFVLEGAPELHDGDVAVLFLANPGDGKLYPLAGGAAVAQQAPDGTFVLPADATGTDAVAFMPADVTGTGPASRGSSGSSTGPASTQSVRSTATKSLKCRRGFKRHKSRGRVRCVKVKKHHKHKRHRH